MPDQNSKNMDENTDFKENTPIILMVDDHPRNLQVLGAILKKHDYSIAVARSGEQALEFVQEVTPDLILLDIMMPLMDGFEVCRRIKSNPATKDIPIIFVTALDSPQDKLTGFQQGGVDYITKPFHQDEVLARVKAHTTIRQQQKELIEKNKLLEEANQTKNRLFSIIAHDLLGPVSNVTEVLKLMAEGIFNQEEQADFTQSALKSSQQTLLLLKNLLFWAKNQRREIDFSPHLINLYILLADNTLLLEGLAKEKNITVELNCDENLNAFADENMLTTVIRNLLSNAIKYTKEEGMITLSAKSTNEGIEIVVKDNGIGIDQENIRQILDPLIHFSTPGTHYEKGTGLGVSLCVEFINRHSGRLLIESEPGSGSSFIIKLPHAPATTIR